MSLILAGLVDVLEGRIGDPENSIPNGNFRHVYVEDDLWRARAAATPRPFYIDDISLYRGAVDTGDYTSGDQMRGAHSVTIIVGYHPQRFSRIEMLGAIMDDETRVRAVLEWEPTCALVDGWTGAEIIESEVVAIDGRAAGDAAPPVLYQLRMEVILSHRDERIP